MGNRSVKKIFNTAGDTRTCGCQKKLEIPNAYMVYHTIKLNTQQYII